MKMTSDRKEGRNKEASTEIQAKRENKRKNVKRDYKH